MNAAAQRRLTVPLAAAVLVLGLVFLALLAGVGRGVHWAPPRALAPLPAQHAATLPPPVPLAHFAPVWQQPLFNPDRKPIAHAASGSSQLGDMVLTGIILTPSLRMALLHDKHQGDANQEVRVHEGDSLPDGSWTLVELKPRSAVFDSTSGRVELQLPAGAPIQQPKGSEAAGPAGASSVPNELPDDSESSGHRLQPPHEDDQNGGGAQNGGDQQDGTQDQSGPASSASSNGAAQSGGAALSALRGGQARTDTSNGERQAERLRQLKAAIQKRRAEQAAAKAHEGDR